MTRGAAGEERGSRPASTPAGRAEPPAPYPTLPYRLLNTGNACYLNSLLQLIRTDGILCGLFCDHRCGAGVTACALCALAADLAPRRRAQRMLCGQHAVLASNRHTLDAPGVPALALNRQEDVGEAWQRLLTAAAQEAQAAAQVLSPEEVAQMVWPQLVRHVGYTLDSWKECGCGARTELAEQDPVLELTVAPWGAAAELAPAVLAVLAGGASGVNCDTCHARAAVQRNRIRETRSVLLIRVERWRWGGGRATKVRSTASLPATLHLPACTYGLAAAACHVGADADAGHWLVHRPGGVVDDDARRRGPATGSCTDRDGSPAHDAALVLYCRT